MDVSPETDVTIKLKKTDWFSLRNYDLKSVQQFSHSHFELHFSETHSNAETGAESERNPVNRAFVIPIEEPVVVFPSPKEVYLSGSNFDGFGQ